MDTQTSGESAEYQQSTLKTGTNHCIIDNTVSEILRTANVRKDSSSECN